MNSLDPLVLHRTTELIYRNSAAGQIICLLTATILVVAHSGAHEFSTLLLWWAVASSVAVYRLWCVRAYQSTNNQTVALWRDRVNFGVSLTGFVWGVGGVFLMTS